MLGHIGWGLALLACTSIATIFGAGTILVAMNAAALSSCPDNSVGGFGPPPAAPPSLPYINLTTTGIFAPAQLSTTERPGTTIMWISGQIPPFTPIDGWLQMVITGLPPGMNANLSSNTSGGVDTSGSSFMMVGFFNISGNLPYPWWVTPAVDLTQNGQPLPPGTPLPSSINIQYKLYSSFSDYSAGCTANCAITSQYNYTISRTGGATVTPCSPGTCIAPSY